MVIRSFSSDDSESLARIHEANGLPLTCLPNFDDPLYVVRQVVELDGRVALGGFIRLIGEAYLILDHDAGTPEERWQALRALCDSVEAAARLRGLTDYSCWVPNELVKSFAPRLKEMGFVQSPWVCFSRVLET
jgi:hypothetical protein